MENDSEECLAKACFTATREVFCLQIKRVRALVDSVEAEYHCLQASFVYRFDELCGRDAKQSEGTFGRLSDQRDNYNAWVQGGWLVFQKNPENISGTFRLNKTKGQDDLKLPK